MGIFTIADLKAADPVAMRKKFSVLMQRTNLELNGIPLETEVATKQRLIFSRSFSTPVTSAARMHEVMAIYAQRSALRLAKDSQQLMTCFAGTSHFNQTAASFPSVTVELPVPTRNSVVLTKAARGELEGCPAPTTARLPPLACRHSSAEHLAMSRDSPLHDGWVAPLYSVGGPTDPANQHNAGFVLPLENGETLCSLAGTRTFRVRQLLPALTALRGVPSGTALL